MADVKPESKRLITRNLIAGAKNDITFPLWGDVFRHQDDTLYTRGGAFAYQLYDDIERDCHAYAVLQKRKMAVVARNWDVIPASDDKNAMAAAELVESQLARINFDSLCLDLMDAVLKGFATVELVWDADGRHFMVDRHVPIDQRRIGFDATRRPRLKTLQNPLKGEELPERKFIIHRFGSKNGNPFGLGLGTRLYWPVYFKRNGIKQWLVFVEKFAAPTAIAEYPEAMSEADQDKLFYAVRNIASQSAVLVPSGTELSLLEATRAGNAGTYQDLCRYMDEQISEAVLGETLSTNIGQSGSRAASDTHNEVRKELTDADCDLLNDCLNDTLVRWLIDINMPDAPLPKIHRKGLANETAEADLEARRSETHQRLYQMGWEPGGDVIAATYGEGWSKRPTALPAQPAPAFAEADKTTPELLADQVNDVTGPGIDKWLDVVRPLVTQAKDPRELETMFMEAYAHRLDSEELINALTAAFALADLQGIVEAEDDAA